MKNEGINAPALALAILLAIGAAITALSLRSTLGYSLGGSLLLLSLLTRSVCGWRGNGSGRSFCASANFSRLADLACSS